MAVTKFEGGWKLTAVGDTCTTSSGDAFRLCKIIIQKATAGTVTFKDADGVVFLLTNSLGDASETQYEFRGVVVSSGFEYDAVSAGTAVVWVYHQGIVPAPRATSDHGV